MFIATIGEYLAASRGVVSVQPVTFAGYARHLRQIVGDIIAAKGSRKARARRRTIRAAIDATPLSVLTPEALQGWRLNFLARAQGDAKRERSARTSCNSIIRQGRSLFAPKVVKFLGTLRLPQPLPFTGVEFFPKESTRYISRVDVIEGGDGVNGSPCHGHDTVATRSSSARHGGCEGTASKARSPCTP